MAGSSLAVGDVVRGVTCTNFVYPTQALFGASAPRRTIVLYGADNQKWPQVFPIHPGWQMFAQQVQHVSHASVETYRWNVPFLMFCSALPCAQHSNEMCGRWL